LAIGRFIYRMVHWQNISHVLQHGLCCRTHENSDPNFINIGHRKLISDRDQHPINIDGKGVLGEYIPFYFSGYSPMLFLIKNGFQGVEKRPQEDLIFIVCKIDEVSQSGVDFFFTDRNAKITIAENYTDIADLDKLDWNSINARDWKNTEENYQKRDLKQAEFLVRYHLPVALIHAIVVKNEEKKAYIVEQLHNFGLNIPVHIDTSSKLYYP
jgi:hypothetical protein